MSKYTNFGTEYTINVNNYSAKDRFGVDGILSNLAGLDDSIAIIPIELNGGVNNNLIESIDIHITISFVAGLQRNDMHTVTEVSIGLNDNNYTSYYSDENSDYDETIHFTANDVDHLTLKCTYSLSETIIDPG
jgi:hypothetical protein